MIGETVWMTWHRKRNGDDARRPSGVGFTRTETAHAFRDNREKSLCGRSVALWPKTAEPDVRKCAVCARRAA